MKRGRNSVGVRQRCRSHRTFLAATCLLVAVLGAFPSAASAEQTVAHDASRLVDSIGVNVHTFFNGSRYYERYEDVTTALLDLGVRHVRDGHQGRRADQFARLNYMADRGIKITLIEDPRADPRYTPADELRSLEDRIAELEAGQIRGVEALEGANEFNTVGSFAPYPGPAPEWMPRLMAAQKRLFELNQRQLRLPLYGPTFTNWQAYAHARDAGMAAWIPIAAIHPYPGGRAPTAGATPGSLAWHRSSEVDRLMGVANAPYVATETGYHNAIDWAGGHPPVPEDVSGAYIPKLVLEYFRQGSWRTFLYELVDTWPSVDLSEREKHFGLFRNRVDENGSFLPLEWKRAAVNLRNLISLLDVPGPGSTPMRLDYSLQGDTAGVHSLLFRRADGKLAIALWQDVELWDPGTRTRLDPPAKTVTVALGGGDTASFSSFLVSRGTAPTGPAQNGSGATVSVPAGDTVILTVAPEPGPPPGSGLRAEYFNGTALSGTPITRVDAQVNFNWSGSPLGGIGGDNFSVRWTGTITPAFTETYTFHTVSDDGVRLWIDDKLVIANWTNHAAVENSGSIALRAGKAHRIRMEFFEGKYVAVARLSWSSPSQPKQLVPPDRLAQPGPTAELGSGLAAEYFATKDLSGVARTRLDPLVNFSWGAGGPMAGLPVDRFSARWTGTITPAFSERYTLYTLADDGVRLWIDDRLVVSDWKDHAATETAGTIDMQAGRAYRLRLDYYENTGAATVRLSWSSPRQPKQIVPTDRLSPG